MTERTPEEWGRAAVALPGWTWAMPWASLPDRYGRVWRRNWCPSDSGFGWTQVCGPKRRDRRPLVEAIDPDDPATAGCLLALLRPTPSEGYIAHVLPPTSAVTKWQIHMNTAQTGRLSAYGSTLGRACIAAAEALGRWPGGAE